jgi:hypothetical protein
MKTFINRPLLIEQCKRFWAIPAFTTVVYLLGVVLPLYSAQQDPWNGRDDMMLMVLSMNHPFLIITSVVVPVGAAIALFTHHFSNTANTAFTAFPVNKRQLFFTNLCAGVLMFAVPLFILCLILLIPVTVVRIGWDYDFLSSYYRIGFHYESAYIWGSHLTHGQVINTFPVVAGFFLRSLLGFGFYYALGILAVSVTGNRLIAGKIAVVVAFFPVLVLFTLMMVASFYVFGYAGSQFFFIDRIMFYMHPVTMGMILNNSWQVRNLNVPGMWLFYLIYFLLAAGMLVAGYFCCQRRKAEHTRDTLVFTPLKNIMVFIMSLAGMVLGGVFFMLMMNGSRVGYYIGFAVGFVLVYIIAQMVVEKSLNIRHKIRKMPLFGGIAAGLYILMLVITRVGVSGYVTHVPDIDDVAGVYIWHHLPENRREGVDFAFISDPNTIARTIDVHNQIIAERRTLQPHLWADMTSQWSAVPTDRFPIAYRLHCGTIITRQYRLPRNFMVRAMAESLIRTEAVILSRHPELLNPHEIVMIKLYLHGESYERFTETIQVVNQTLNNMKIHTLTEAIRRDIVNANIHDRQRWVGERPWQNRETLSVSVEITLQGGPTDNTWRHLWISEPVSIMAWLNQHGY